MDDPDANLVQHTLIEVTRSAFANGLSEFLLIGGNAVIAYGVPRFTRDVDLVIPERVSREWRNLMEGLNFELFHGTNAFLQFHDRYRIKPRVDLMVVDDGTWEKLSANPYFFEFEDQLNIPLAEPQHIIAMKLKAHNSEHRRNNANDWTDILGLCRLHQLDPETNSAFQELVLRYGSTEDLAKLISDLDEKSPDSKGHED